MTAIPDTIRSAPTLFFFFFFNDPAPPEFYPLPLPAPLPTPDLRRQLRDGPARHPRRPRRQHPRPRAGWRAIGALRPVEVAALRRGEPTPRPRRVLRSEEHTSELQSQSNLVCRLLLEKKKKQQ